MDETALAVLVFDGQKEDLFETLGQWDRDLTRAARKEFAKLLVAGRVDAGGLRASRSEVEKFAAERKFQGFLETSAKRNLGCEELRQAILDAIPWDELPCRTTEVLFKRLKDEGRVLMRFNELRETLQLRLSGELARFADAELRAVLTLLAGPGVVSELAFGSWVLLQPERINAYAQAVIRTLQSDEHQRGCLMEERVLKGDLMYESSVERLQGDEERFVLLAMHQTLVERGFQPVRAKENSPAIHRWVPGQEGNKSRQGRKRDSHFTPFLSPLRGLDAFGDRCPSDKSLGYSRGIGYPPLKRRAIFGRP